ncbi:signal peptidase I [Porcincola intestinalis]|uniref:signal peptidase I n=1 Tax=Porcincola intestinalis TaxID=2606632 RepID=UPI002A915350|nr:signal peptidase I [Porcincola intestinalis]
MKETNYSTDNRTDESVGTSAKRGKVFFRVFLTIITGAAAAALIAAMLLPILRIYGTSMSPTLQEGDVVVAMKTGSVHQGELAAFYFNNKILVKRVIAGPGDQVDLDDAGNVIVNGRALDEPYLTSRSKGDTTDLTYPYQVPKGRYFLMGDHRETSMDSRNSQIGCIGQDRMAGRILLRVWPLRRFGLVK